MYFVILVQTTKLYTMAFIGPLNILIKKILLFFPESDSIFLKLSGCRILDNYSSNKKYIYIFSNQPTDCHFLYSWNWCFKMLAAFIFSNSVSDVFTFILRVCVASMYVCVCITFVQCSWRCVSPCGCWEPKQGSLCKTKKNSTADPSLKHHIFIYF